MEKLIISHLKMAILSLEEALSESLKKPEDDLYRDAVIKRFEYTYELSFKTLRRFLSLSIPETEMMTLPELIRVGWRNGLLKSSWDVWHNFRDARNKTSHVYSEKIAQEVYANTPKFLEEARYLYDQMEKKLQ
jgi:nucleotidyltransferase substrate binding protein (TIGR01987 family)